LKVYELKGVEVKELPGATDITVWIDPKLLLPVHTRLQHRQKDKTVTITLDVLGWNEELDVKIFELTVPPGYKLTEPPEKK
jgi:outer membrane lipoprotein-sorting protein